MVKSQIWFVVWNRILSSPASTSSSALFPRNTISDEVSLLLWHALKRPEGRSFKSVLTACWLQEILEFPHLDRETNGPHSCSADPWGMMGVSPSLHDESHPHGIKAASSIMWPTPLFPPFPGGTGDSTLTAHTWFKMVRMNRKRGGCRRLAHWWDWETV